MTLSAPSFRIAVPLALVAALVAAGGAIALQKPGRTKTVNGPVRLARINQASFAYMVARTKTDCDHIELWDTDTKGTWRFGKPGPCTNVGSTGSGISSLGVSGNRVVWVRYNGGNLRDWLLMTATTTQKTPKQLRFVEQDVDLATPPIVVGDSTASMGIPFAAGKEVVLLGTNGVAVFKVTETAPVVAVTAGKGPAGAVVAALLQSGEVVLHKINGSVAWTEPYSPGAVKAMALAPVGLVAQLPGAVQTKSPSTSSVATLPAGAAMVDFAEGRILYTLNGEVHAFKTSTSKDTLLLKSASGAPAIVPTIDTYGFGWGQRTKVSFACGGCVTYGP